MKVFKLMSAILLVTTTVAAISPSVGICYAGCATLAVACFAAAGAVFGVANGPVIGASKTLTACNSAFGKCESACTSAFGRNMS